MMTQAPADTRLYAGQRLTLTEFFRRYEAQPDLHRIELLRGVVVMPSPVRNQLHGKQVGFLATLLGIYSFKLVHVERPIGSTIRLNDRDVVEPDLFLRIVDACNGNCRQADDGYLDGPPELIFEICGSTKERDLVEKRAIYEEAEVLEYIVWLTESQEFRWLVVQNEEYVEQAIPADHILKSVAFPGLWIDLNACLQQDVFAAQATLQLGLQSADFMQFQARLEQRRS